MTKKQFKLVFEILSWAVIAFLLWKAFFANRPNKEIDTAAFTVVNAQGQQVHLDDFKGKPVFLNFWATWCGPCVREMPSIQKAQEKYADKGIEFLIVNTEPNAFQQIERFEANKSYGLNYYAVRDYGNIEVKQIPLTYLIGKDGKVKKVVNRSKNWASASSFEQLENLLK